MAGWVSSHGYPNMWARYQHLRQMLTQPRTSSHLFKQYGISYIAKDWRIVNDNGFDDNFYEYSDQVKLVFSSSKYAIYDVKEISFGG